MSFHVYISLFICLVSLHFTVTQPPPANLIPLVLSRGSRAWLNRLLIPPPDGSFRPIRREIRLLTDDERRHCFEVINFMKRDTLNGMVFPSRYDVLANLHESTAARGAHGGPAFLGWHRVYTILFENAMREIDSNLTIPYWDMTMDQPVGVNSVMFTGGFFGNGNGPVVSGMFANWRTPSGILRRAVGAEGSLMSPVELSAVMSQRTLASISYPTAVLPFNLEELHNRVHMWVGGHMRRSETSSRDPIFFFLHSYYDCVWELFRDRQKLLGINPNVDYPFMNFGRPAHAPNRRLGLGPFSVIDSIRDTFAQRFFICERFPECPTGSCGSRYLRCIRGRCVSRTRSRNGFTPFGGGFFPGAMNPMRNVFGGQNIFSPFGIN